MFNPMPQARPVLSAINLACGIGLNDQNLFTALGFALDHEGVEYRLEWIAETAETLPLVALTL